MSFDSGIDDYSICMELMPRQENKKQYLFNSVVYFVYKNFNGNFIILHRYKFAICANFDIFIFHY